MAWVRSLPPVRRRLVLGTVFVTVYGGVYLLMVFVPVWLGRPQPKWDAPLGGLIGGIVGTSGVTWWQRRRVGAMLLPELTRAVRTGRLPEDADPSVWRPLLLREQGAWRRLLLVFQALLAVVVVTTVAVGLAQNRSWRLLIPALLLVIAVAGLVEWTMRRRDRRTDELLQQLDARL